MRSISDIKLLDGLDKPRIKSRNKGRNVYTERDIRKRLEVFPMLEHEWDYYHMREIQEQMGWNSDEMAIDDILKVEVGNQEVVVHRK